MKVWTHDRLPRFWWLNPWGTAKALHEALVAFKALEELDARLIETQERAIYELRDRIDHLHMDIIAGRAVVPDAEPVAEEGGQP